jgi:diguanylate cyclase (GGDEF)-like protein/PAS domain S-box-containing protein
MTPATIAGRQLEQQLLAGLDHDSPWSTISDQIGLAVAVLDADFGFLRVNHAFAAANGKTRDYFLGRHYFELLPPSAVEEIFRQVRDSGVAHTQVARPRLPNLSPTRGLGQWNWSLTPFAGADDAPVGTTRYLVLTMQEVSASVNAEVRARQREDELWAMLGRMPGMTYRAGADWSGSILLNCEGLTGYSAAEINAMPNKWLSLIHPDDVAAVLAEGELLRTGQQQATITYRIVDKDGTPRWVEDRKSSLFAADGSFAGVEGIVVDASRHKAQEQLLAARVGLTELARNASPDEILQAALDAVEELTGSSTGFIHFVAPDPDTPLPEGLEELCAATRQGTCYPFEEAGGRATGASQGIPLAADESGLPEGDGADSLAAPPGRQLTVPVVLDGRLVAVIIVCNKSEDYTPEDAETASQIATLAIQVVLRKQVERDLRLSERRFRGLFDSMTSGFALHEIVVDAEGRPCDYRFLDVNPAFQAITGIARSDLVGRCVREVLPMIEEHWIERYGAVALSGECAQFDDYSSDLDRHYRVTAYCPEPGRFATICDDITAIRRGEESLRQAARVFEQMRDGVAITDAEATIVAVNRAFTEITGYSSEEAVGQSTRLLKSGHHDAAFYAAMWQDLQERGFWQGEIVNRRKSGETYPEWLTISGVVSECGATESYIGVFTDTSRLRDAEARAEFIAYHDALTRLPNRTLLSIRYEHALERAQRHGTRLALLIVDLDLFKNVNDSFGYEFGDRLLVAISERFRSRLRDEDTLARLHGDEFALLMEDIDVAAGAAVLARDLLQVLEAPFRIGDVDEVYIGASIGISISPDDGSELTLLLRNAEAAANLAKQQGRKTLRFYTESLTTQALERMSLESRLRKAIENGQLLLHYQPLIEAKCGDVIGAEALVRWPDPEQGMIPPMRFIPVAEDSGLIAPLGAWVLTTACRQMKAWLDAGRRLQTIAVNLSPRQFFLQDVPQLVRQTLADTGLDAHFLELEITEGILIERGEEAVAILNRIRAIGVRLSIDDFGTGYSSLSYLKRFPIDKLKIDQSFVRDITSNASAAEITSTIIAMGRSLKLSVLAEGVETPSQLAFLEHHGCDYYQGYLFSRPLPAEQFPEHCPTPGR